MADSSGTVREVLPWLQLAALVIAAVVAIQSIRGTTETLGVQIHNLTAAVTTLTRTVDTIDSRLDTVEKNSAYDQGVRDGMKGGIR